jgi:hypothetical protein
MTGGSEQPSPYELRLSYKNEYCGCGNQRKQNGICIAVALETHQFAELSDKTLPPESTRADSFGSASVPVWEAIGFESLMPIMGISVPLRGRVRCLLKTKRQRK